MKEYDVYLFDWDGTLARTLEVWSQGIHATALEYGLDVAYEDMGKHLGDLRWPLMYGLPEARLDQFLQDSGKAVYSLLPGVQLYDDAAEVLKLLKQRGKLLALVTTSNRAEVESAMGDRAALRNVFDLMVTRNDVTKHKPDPEGIHHALKGLGVSKDRALMLGDTEKDIKAACGAGIDSLLYYPDSHEKIYDLAYLQSFKPTYTVHSWRSFLDTVQ
ncbi:MAG TPA: HAD-IA family hydrolase [Patescibacteria group bacterium]|nr:HAD-IA family hydrolase [Patescibacteria group bacterium]